jgi:hypothetical protein
MVLDMESSPEREYHFFELSVFIFVGIRSFHSDLNFFLKKGMFFIELVEIL